MAGEEATESRYKGTLPPEHVLRARAERLHARLQEEFPYTEENGYDSNTVRTLAEAMVEYRLDEALDAQASSDLHAFVYRQPNPFEVEAMENTGTCHFRGNKGGHTMIGFPYAWSVLEESGFSKRQTQALYGQLYEVISAEFEVLPCASGFNVWLPTEPFVDRLPKRDNSLGCLPEERVARISVRSLLEAGALFLAQLNMGSPSLLRAQAKIDPDAEFPDFAVYVQFPPVIWNNTQEKWIEIEDTWSGLPDSVPCEWVE